MDECKNPEKSVKSLENYKKVCTQKIVEFKNLPFLFSGTSNTIRLIILINTRSSLSYPLIKGLLSSP